MKSLISISVAGSLALAAVTAHAAITVPNSTSVSGDVLLYGAIYNSAGTVLGGYIGDTGVSVDSIVSGTKPATSLGSDSNLATFLGEATAGTTIMWSVVGGGAKSDGTAQFVTTTSTGINPAINESTVGTWVSSLGTNLRTINGGSTSLQLSSTNTAFTTDLTTLDGIGYNPNGTTVDMSGWGGGNQFNFIKTVVGSGATSFGSNTLYTVTAPGFNGITLATSTPAYTVTLTTSGLTYTAISAVPLPAAVWLLGSGLLGLVGVARRKIAA
jgi:hypothetical protein